jgi:hypothetical protein
MKIYCEPLGKTVEIEEHVKNVIAKTPDDLLPEIKTIINILSELAVTQYQRSMELHQENAKLRCMWSLRNLEDEINEEGGQIIITAESKVKIRGFSPILAAKIAEEANNSGGS